MEKLTLIVEILKLLIKTNSTLSTGELHSKLYSEGILPPTDDRVARRKLLRALNTLLELGYLEEVGDGKVKRWKLNQDRFKFLSSYTRDELISLIVLFSFFPSHYRDLPFFRKAFEAISRFEKELNDEERELLRFSFERIPNVNERCVNLEPELFKSIISTILENKGAYLQYRGKVYKLFPVKFFTYNGLFYIGALTPKGYRNFLVSRIEHYEPLNQEISLDEKKKKVKETFEIPDEEPFLFGALLPDSYATEKEIERGIKFSPYQFFIEKRKGGIAVYLVGFTGKRFASWFLTEKVLELYPPDTEIIEMAKNFGVKELVPKLTFQLQVNRQRFKTFKATALKILKGRLRVFKKN
ncbi:helix-turn-helix transcriptional regulator [Thermovibrio sp.]